MKLEVIEDIALAHPFNKGFDKVYFCKTDDDAWKIAHCETDANAVAEPVNLATGETAGEVKDEDKGNVQLYTTTYYIGLELVAGMLSLVNAADRQDARKSTSR